MAAVEAAIAAEEYAGRPLNEALLLECHQRVCGDLVPEWAGRWRAIEVRVGNLNPSLPHLVPVMMRDYVLDLQARWSALRDDAEEGMIEFLAFAEGRFLTIHPFRDFNGRTIRLFLKELLRRLDLPGVVLAPEAHAERAEYFLALEAADKSDWSPLVRIWKVRFDNAG